MSKRKLETSYGKVVPRQLGPYKEGSFICCKIVSFLQPPILIFIYLFNFFEKIPYGAC